MQSSKSVLLLVTIITFVAPSAIAQTGKEGAPVSIKLSPSFSIPGRNITLSGTTLVGKTAVELSLMITGPKGIKEGFIIKTNSKGGFTNNFAKTNTAGWYAFKIVTADKKNSATDSLYIADVNDFSGAFAGKMSQLTTAAKNASAIIDEKVSELPPSAELTEFKEKNKQLKQKLNELRTKADQSQRAMAKAITAMSDVPKVMEKVDPYLKQMDSWSEEAAMTIPDLDKRLTASKLKATTCDNLNNVAELFGIISLCMNFQGKFLQICINLSSDKALPGIIDRQSFAGDNAMVEAKKTSINEAQKTATTVVQGASAMTDFITKGFVLDMAQFATKVLYAQMCTEIKGPANATFNAAFDADNGQKYWTYDISLKGTLTLRYDKKADLSQPVAVTGEFEGVRTGYKFWEEIEQVEQIPKNMVVFARIRTMPKAIDLSAIGNDLGMVARNLVPGSYRVKVKGQVVNNKLTLEIDDSPFDAIENAKAENNTLEIICVTPIVPIPLIKRFNFPIASSKVILYRSLGKTHQFNLNKSGQKVSITDNVTNKTELSNGSVHLSSSVSLNVNN